MDMAYRPAKAFDTSVDFWINLQTAVDLWEVENDMRVQEELSRINTAEKFISQRNMNKKQPDIVKHIQKAHLASGLSFVINEH